MELKEGCGGGRLERGTALVDAFMSRTFYGACKVLVKLVESRHEDRVTVEF